MNRDRLEFFSDSVFAVAITLLALNLAIAGPGHGPLADQLAHQWQAFVAYLISFFTIGVIWVNHHSLVSAITVVTRPLTYFNLVLLLFVVLVPVATRLLAQYLSAGGSGSHLAAAVYGMVVEGTGIGFVLLLEWALREGHMGPPIPPGRRWAARLRYLPGPVINLVSIGAAFINPLLTLGLFGASAIYYMFGQAPLLARDSGGSQPGARGQAAGRRSGRLPRRPGSAIRASSRARRAAHHPVQARRGKPAGFRR
ncbi:MAG TPA: TMEM175 family protein [Trebonia sp.]|nr:TMEM175 family protein [Trebonia sp.]